MLSIYAKLKSFKYRSGLIYNQINLKFHVQILDLVMVWQNINQTLMSFLQ